MVSTPGRPPVPRSVTCWRTHRGWRCIPIRRWPARHPPDVFELRFHRAGRSVQRESGISSGATLFRGGVRTPGHGDHPAGRGPRCRRVSGATSTVADLAVFAGDLLRPSTVSAQMHADATTVQFPGLDGVLPGYVCSSPMTGGLGFEIRNSKSHWTGGCNSTRTFGHFGQSRQFHLGGSQGGPQTII